MLISSSLIADISFKIIFVGDSDVGKSALINRFKNDTFDFNSRPTIGVEFAKRIVTFRKSNQNIQTHLWDTAGQERYKSITKQHYRGADGALTIFDLDKPASFASTIQWLNEARDNSPPNCVLGMIGNKADITTETSRTISRQAFDFARENGILYFETSALWSRTQGGHPDKFYAKGIENIILDTIENVGIINPKKAICLEEKETLFENDSENVTVGSVYEMIPSRLSVHNMFGDTSTNGVLHTKGSSAHNRSKEVQKVNLNIKSEKAKDDSGCSCV